MKDLEEWIEDAEQFMPGFEDELNSMDDTFITDRSSTDDDFYIYNTLTPIDCAKFETPEYKGIAVTWLHTYEPCTGERDKRGMLVEPEWIEKQGWISIYFQEIGSDKINKIIELRTEIHRRDVSKYDLTVRTRNNSIIEVLWADVSGKLQTSYWVDLKKDYLLAERDSIPERKE